VYFESNFSRFSFDEILYEATIHVPGIQKTGNCIIFDLVRIDGIPRYKESPIESRDLDFFRFACPTLFKAIVVPVYSPWEEEAKEEEEEKEEEKDDEEEEENKNKSKKRKRV